MTIWLTDHPGQSAFYPRRDAIASPPHQKAIALCVPIPSNGSLKV
ncbi:MAG: hypothetical protein ACKN87_20320 [Microcystis aeruginosa]